MIRALVLATATLVLTASLGATWTNAQTGTDPSRSTAGPKSDTMRQTVEGTIKRVRGNLVTLEDGTELSIPAGVKVAKERLKPGAQITAEYKDRGGQKIAKSVEIRG
jgi:hypothetical protein